VADPVREPAAVFVALKMACDAHPDQRVAQVFANALYEAGHGRDPFYVEDREAAQALSDYASQKRVA
jgi:hypothetical protein